MAYIPLVEYRRPRVLMLDFSPQDVAKVQKTGFDARRGGTGLHDHDKFHFPFAVQGVEIVFAQVASAMVEALGEVGTCSFGCQQQRRCQCYPRK